VGGERGEKEGGGKRGGGGLRRRLGGGKLADKTEKDLLSP
jgi:hypothetical protein